MRFLVQITRISPDFKIKSKKISKIIFGRLKGTAKNCFFHNDGACKTLKLKSTKFSKLN